LHGFFYLTKEVFEFLICYIQYLLVRHTIVDDFSTHTICSSGRATKAMINLCKRYVWWFHREPKRQRSIGRPKIANRNTMLEKIKGYVIWRVCMHACMLYLG